jgi:hypothetical protein
VDKRSSAIDISDSREAAQAARYIAFASGHAGAERIILLWRHGTTIQQIDKNGMLSPQLTALE